MIVASLLVIAFICWCWCFVLWAWSSPQEAGSVVAKLILYCVHIVAILAATLTSFWAFDLLLN